MKTMRRDVLKKQIEAGKFEAMCEMDLTDDYQFDNAYNFRKTTWMPARVSHPEYQEFTLENKSVITRCVNDDRMEGFLNFQDYDFTGKCGYACVNDDGTITLKVTSNNWYKLRMKTQ